MAQFNFIQQEYFRKNFGTIGRGVADKKTYRSITIEVHRPEDIYQFFRNFENLTYFMKGIQSIRVDSPVRSHWSVQLKSGSKVEWDADIIEEIPGVMISWRSLPEGTISSTGSIWLSKAPRGRGTIVNLTMDYDLPGGKIADLATLFAGDDLDSLALTNLYRMKAYLETGEVPTTEGQSSGRESINFDKMTTRH